MSSASFRADKSIDCKYGNSTCYSHGGNSVLRAIKVNLTSQQCLAVNLLRATQGDQRDTDNISSSPSSYSPTYQRTTQIRRHFNNTVVVAQFMIIILLPYTWDMIRELILLPCTELSSCTIWCDRNWKVTRRRLIGLHAGDLFFPPTDRLRPPKRMCSCATDCNQTGEY